jgi:heat shock protein HtpX
MLVYDRISWNRRNAFLLPLAALALSAPLTLVVSLALALGLSRISGSDWVAGGVFAVATGLMIVLWIVLWDLFSGQAPKLLGVYGARPAAEPEQRILENLAIGAGIPKPKLFVIEGGAPNAFAIGAPGHAIVGVTSPLLGLLDHRELEGVLAHELSHIANGDAHLNAVVAALVLLMRLPRLLWERHESIQEQTRLIVPRYRSFGFDWSNTWSPNIFGRTLFFLLLPVWVYFLLAAPVLGALLRGVISREREFLADANAALLTRYPEGLICALAKIQGAGSFVQGNPAVAHFYFAEAVEPEAAVFATHPTVGQRIAKLMEIHGELAPAIVEAALQAGARFAREHPPCAAPDGLQVQDELSVLNMGNVMGRVYRALSPGCLYDHPNAASPVLAHVTQGSLLVVFDDPGPFRQALTAQGVFGYLPLSVRLEQTEMLPAELVAPRVI